MHIKVIADARKLLKKEGERFANDVTVFFEIIAKQNVAQLRLVFEQYEKLAGHNIFDVIEKDFSSNFPVIDHQYYLIFSFFKYGPITDIDGHTNRQGN